MDSFYRFIFGLSSIVASYAILTFLHAGNIFITQGIVFDIDIVFVMAAIMYAGCYVGYKLAVKIEYENYSRELAVYKENMASIGIPALVVNSARDNIHDVLKGMTGLTTKLLLQHLPSLDADLKNYTSEQIEHALEVSGFFGHSKYGKDSQGNWWLAYQKFEVLLRYIRRDKYALLRDSDNLSVSQ